MLVGMIVGVKGFDSRREVGEDPTLDAHLEFSNGASGFLHACDATMFSIFEMDIIGTNGRVYIKDFGHLIEVYRVTDSPYYSGYSSLALSETIRDGLKDTLLHAVTDMVRCLQTGQKPRCAGNEGIAAVKVAQAIRMSVVSGNDISLEK
jgi:predicted dehydrogenase